MDPILEGIQISIVGIILAFTFMAIFIGVMVGLQKLFPAKVDSGKEPDPVSTPVETLSNDDTVDEEIAAVIAVALAKMRVRNQNQLGGSLEEGRSTWWLSNRLRAQQDNGLQRKQAR